MDDTEDLPPGRYEGIIVRDADTGEILSVEYLGEDAEFPDDVPPESWLARNRALLDALRPITEIASLAGTPAMRAAVAGAWIVVDAARLRQEPQNTGTRLRIASLGLAGLGLAAGLRGAPAALRAKAGVIARVRRAVTTAEQVIRARNRA